MNTISFLLEFVIISLYYDRIFISLPPVKRRVSLVAFSTFSHSLSPTARLFLLSSYFQENESYVIITDKSEDRDLFEKFGSRIFSHHIERIETVERLWNLENTGYIYIIHPHLLQTEGSIEYLKRQTSITVSRGMNMSMEDLIDAIIQLGYIHRDHLEDRGTYKKEGSIITVTHPFRDEIIQIEYFDTEIDSIILTDRAKIKREFLDAILFPRVKSLPFEVKSVLESDKSKKKEALDRDTLAVLIRREGVVNKELLSTLSKNRIIIGCDFLPYLTDLLEEGIFYISDFQREDAVALDISPVEVAHIDEFASYLRENNTLAKICIYTRYTKPITDFLEFHHIEGVKVIEIAKSNLESVSIPSESFSLFHRNIPQNLIIGEPENLRTIIISDDILSPIFVRSRNEKSIAKHLDLLLQIKVGDYVVHRDHGIGRFAAMVIKELSGIRREYLELHYAEGDILFVPLTEIYRVSKYVGELDPTLTQLEGKEWERVMEKTDEELELIATELIEIGAKRSIAKGIQFGRFPEEDDFRKAFSYVHTVDQSTAIDDIRKDMESEQPMDRLLSGDVGFGKTEVAMNALYKAVLSGYQAAVISPLLVLADEHYETFVERLGAFGVRIACLTRMTSPKEEKSILLSLKNGKIDVIVGTHRLLSEDIRFSKLGLLVIDEEHKFGVTHKERFKKMRSNVDILSLSATPIPRSLNLALSGLKKISVLSTPPAKKKPIQTIVSRWNESTIAHAISYEKERGGSVIIVHNRIGSMTQVEDEIQRIVLQSKSKTRTDKNLKTGKLENLKTPTIVTTHGRLSGDLIEDRIHAFKKGEYDILLTTTIIENGVNFLSANTIIIIDPEEFGLAQLHQLRGRVGRKDVQGYCYLVYRKPELAEQEKERIITITNNTHLGAGFEIAMRDMEIRGAGDVLGLKQAGKSKEVGLSLYFRLLEEKIEILRNERKTRSNIKIELDLSYAISDDFFSGEMDKLAFFRDIESLETLEEIESTHSVFRKQFSSLPMEVENLFLFLKSRIILADYGVLSLKKIGTYYVFDFSPDMRVEKMKAFLERFDPKKNMVLLSLQKVRVETRYFQNAKELLESVI